MAGNWRSGRRPTPTALHVLRGTLRSSVRQGREGEPKRKPGRPPCPVEVEADEAAHAHWLRLATQLEKDGILTMAHGDALALLAQALADYHRVRGQLAAMKHQQLVIDEIRDKDGKLLRRRVRENPLIRRSERLAALCSRLLGEFGLTPVTQTRVHADPQATSRASRYVTRLG